MIHSEGDIISLESQVDHWKWAAAEYAKTAANQKNEIKNKSRQIEELRAEIMRLGNIITRLHDSRP